MKSIFALCLLLCLSATYASVDVYSYNYFVNNCYKPCQAQVCKQPNYVAEYPQMNDCRDKITRGVMPCITQNCKSITKNDCNAIPKCPNESQLVKDFHTCFYGCNFDPQYPVQPRKVRFLEEQI